MMRPAALGLASHTCARRYLQEEAAKVRSNKISLKKYVINKGLTKAPDEYSDANSQPHVQVRAAELLYCAIASKSK